MTSEQHVLTFQAFLVRPPLSTRVWARAEPEGVRNPSNVGYKEALMKDRNGAVLTEPCSRPDLVVTKYDEPKGGLFRLPAQGWDQRVGRRCGTPVA